MVKGMKRDQTKVRVYSGLAGSGAEVFNPECPSQIPHIPVL